MSLKWPPKDKDETLDYSLDWSRALEGGETIQTVSWYIVDSSDAKVSFTAGLTIEGLSHISQSSTATVATVYLSLGNENQEYKLYCSITTTSGRVKERSVKLRIREFN
jgi:hypothetical protein